MPFQQNKNELVAPQLKVFSIEPFVNYCCKNDYRRKYFGQECNNYDDPETKQSSQWKNMTPPPLSKKVKVTQSLGKNMFIRFMDRMLCYKCGG